MPVHKHFAKIRPFSGSVDIHREFFLFPTVTFRDQWWSICLLGESLKPTLLDSLTENAKFNERLGGGSECAI